MLLIRMEVLETTHCDETKCVFASNSYTIANKLFPFPYKIGILK